MKRMTFPVRFSSQSSKRDRYKGVTAVLHGGGTTAMCNRFDVAVPLPMIRMPSLFDSFSRLYRDVYLSRHDISFVQKTKWKFSFDALRTLFGKNIPGAFDANPCRCERYRNRFDSSVDRNVFSMFVFVSRFDLRHLGKDRLLCIRDSFENFPQTKCVGRFQSFRGGRITVRSRFDTIPDWRRDLYRAKYDFLKAENIFLRNRFDAVVDVSLWPVANSTRFAFLIENPLTRRIRSTGRLDVAEQLPRSRFIGLFDAFGHLNTRFAMYRRAFVRPGWRIVARNLETLDLLDLGFIDMGSGDHALEGVFLPDGDYEFSVLTSSLFWNDCSDRNIRTLSIRSGEEMSPLPVVYNLRSSISQGQTTIRWSANKSDVGDCVFGVWFSSESPVDVNRPPDQTVWYFSSQTEYATTFSQNAPAWVAVAAMRIGDEPELGKVHELYLDWNNVPPRAPDDVMVLNAPIPVIDGEVETRHEEDPFMLLWNS